MIVIIINNDTNSNLLMLWFRHYITLNIKFSIVIENIEQKYNYIDNKFIIKREEINKDDILITENDFIFSYKKEDECMGLSKNIKNDEINKPQIIGRVFLVPVKDKPYYTTFEIPDFILYNHSDHTNYTKYGIHTVNEITGNEISKNLVCLSMKISDCAMDTEYYENNILFENNICEVVYKNFCYEILINKEHKYGIIWNNKSGSSTITTLFANYNEIKINNSHLISKNFIKYRYNNYLQNINIVNFIRHPFLRFISCYFNKHIDKKDKKYLILDNYLIYLKQYNEDTILNFANFLKNKNIIDEHSTNLSDLYYLNKYKNLKYENYDIDDNVNKKLDSFFTYHKNKKYIIIENYTNKINIPYNTNFKNYNYDDWINFKKKNNSYPTYSSIIDEELINILKIIYNKDLIKFNYDNYNISKNTIPSNFKPEIYREINPDLKKLNDVECINHYIFYGINENRKYIIDFSKLPSNFDVYQYKYFNPDLQKMNNTQCINHYIEHGVKEERKYKDIYFCKDYFCQKYNYKKTDDIYLKYINDLTQEKNNYFKIYIDTIKIDISQKYLLLVNHDNKCFGASHYLYLLYNLLKQKMTYIQILLCEVNINNIILQNYNINKENVIEYKNDPTLLYLLYKKINPKIIYFNSCNDSIYNIYSYIPKEICIYHSHEVKKHYILSNKITPDFVVSNKILKLYSTPPLVQTPIISSIEHIIELSNEPVEEIRNNFGIIDLNKINIGMSGQITDRKNYKLFIEISILYPQYNFIWIGDNSNVFNNYSNIYHIKHTLNPYKFYKQILDYFILFSLIDPCPYVVLENILLETYIITFRDNIYYNHKDEIIKNIYNEYPSNINKHSVIDSINIYVKNKKIIKTDYGKQYIEKNFTNINNIITKINELLTISK